MTKLSESQKACNKVIRQIKERHPWYKKEVRDKRIVDGVLLREPYTPAILGNLRITFRSFSSLLGTQLYDVLEQDTCGVERAYDKDYKPIEIGAILPSSLFVGWTRYGNMEYYSIELK
jgi:hypothetical protein